MAAQTHTGFEYVLFEGDRLETTVDAKSEAGPPDEGEPRIRSKENVKSVSFQGPNDPLDPLNWSNTYKWFAVVLVSMSTTIVTFATLMCTPAAPQILDEFNTGNQLYAVLLVSVWEMGEGVGVLIIAPLSEVFGRLPLWHTANVLFCLFSLGGGLSINMPMLIAFRFLNGVAVASISLEPAIISDLFAQEKRGTPMALTAIAPLLAPSMAPIIGSYLSQAKGWRWVFWLITIAEGAFEALSIFFLRETYRVKILQKKTLRVQKETGDLSVQSEYGSLKGMEFFKKTVLRPAKLFYLSPIVSLFSIYMAIVYGYIYVVFTTETEVFQNVYGFSEGNVGLAFLGIGALIGVLICSSTSDWYVKKKAAGGEMKPEYRLPPMVLGGISLPIGLFVYGWTLQAHTHWIGPIVGTALIGFGLMVTMIPIQTYLVDAFTLYSASVIAAGKVLSSFAGGLLPLVGPPLYARLGLGWGNSLLGFIALLFVPVPLVFIYFGERIRKQSKLELEM